MDSELEVKISKLPAWAREYIRELKIRAEPNLDEMVRLRLRNEDLKKTVAKQKDRIEAMVAMFQCAAKGGNEVAQAVQRIVEDYIISDEE